VLPSRDTANDGVASGLPACEDTVEDRVGGTVMIHSDDLAEMLARSDRRLERGTISRTHRR
jgi:hypothetical protein